MKGSQTSRENGSKILPLGIRDIIKPFDEIKERLRITKIVLEQLMEEEVDRVFIMGGKGILVLS